MSPSSLLFTGASRTGLGAHMQDLTSMRTWTSQENEFHVNMLEKNAVELALNAFLHRIIRDLGPFSATRRLKRYQNEVKV